MGWTAGLLSELSRIPSTTPHWVGVETGVAEAGSGHGWSASGYRDGVRCRGVGGAGAVSASRRSGPGACHFVVGAWLDRRADRSCFWRDAGQRAAVADVVHGRGCRWVVCAPAGWSGADQERGGLDACARGSVGAGGRSAKLDPAAIASRTGGAQQALDLPSTAQQGAERRGFRWRRPRHYLHGRQGAQAVNRSGLRLRVLRQQAAAGDIVLLFGGESGALTHPYLAHAWAERGADLRVPAPGQARKRALLGVRDHGSGELVVHVSTSKRSTDFIARRRSCWCSTTAQSTPAGLSPTW